MLKTISRLLFGGQEEETPDEKTVTSGEEMEEGWLVVSHQEAESAEKQEVEPTDGRPSNSANMEADVSGSEPEPTTPSSRAAVSAPQPRALLTVAHQLTCIQKAKAWADPHHASRHAMQRQNRVRQGVQHPSFHLQQPGHRSLSH